MSLTPHVRFHIAGGVATIELARPEKKTALTIARYDAIAEGLRIAGLDLGDFLERPFAGRDTPLSSFMLESPSR